jgi:hypothetical protein
MGEKRRKMAPAVAVMAVGVLGALFTVAGVSQLVSNFALATRAQRAVGTVLERHHLHHTTYEVKVRFRAGEQDVDFTEMVSGFVAPSTGNQVTVLYDLGNPQKSRVQIGFNDYVLPSLGLACGLTFCAPLLVVLVRRVAKRSTSGEGFPGA